MKSWPVCARSWLNSLPTRSSTTEHTAVYDLEPGHTPADPRVRRIKAPHKVHAVFDEVVRSPEVIAILKALLGPGLRLHNSKLNMKSARYGSPVEWHQDWAFYPHTNDDVLAIGVLLDDTDLSNGPMLVTPGTHIGPVCNHHDSEGRFAGLIDPDDIRAEIERAVPCMGRAGSMSLPSRARAARLGAEHLRPPAQPAALRSRGQRCLAPARAANGLGGVRQRDARGRAGVAAADEGRAGAPAVSAAAASRLDLRDAVRFHQTLLQPRLRETGENAGSFKKKIT